MYIKLTCYSLLVWLSFASTARSQNIGWFWHVTDFHWDFTYQGRNLSCNRDYSDTYGGVYGDYWCDSPWRLCQDAVESMKQEKQDIDFILWTGDSVVHAADEHLSTDTNDAILGNLTNLLADAFPNAQVYPTFGNHDYWPSGQFPATGNEMYNRTFMNWRRWINDTLQEKTFLKGAYYTAKDPHGLRIVALNTNLYYTSNGVTKEMEDPADQLKWLDDVLSMAEEQGETVLVTGHISSGVVAPGGFYWMNKQHNDAFNDVILRHSKIIAGMHFGHDHYDKWRLFYSSSGEPVVPIFIAPSVTPWRYAIVGSGHNPAVRLVKYDRDNGQHLDIVQYYMDLQASNRNNQSDWSIEYNMTSGYDIPDITPLSLSKLIEKMKAPDNVHLKNYNKRRVVSAPEDVVATCDDKCFKDILCSFQHLDIDKFNSCIHSAAPVLLQNSVVVIYGVISYFVLRP